MKNSKQISEIIKGIYLDGRKDGLRKASGGKPEFKDSDEWFGRNKKIVYLLIEKIAEEWVKIKEENQQTKKSETTEKVTNE